MKPYTVIVRTETAGDFVTVFNAVSMQAAEHSVKFTTVARPGVSLGWEKWLHAYDAHIGFGSRMRVVRKRDLYPLLKVAVFEGDFSRHPMFSDAKKFEGDNRRTDFRHAVRNYVNDLLG